MPATSLSGDWTGVYDYSDASTGEPVSFHVSLTDIGGVVWGTSIEKNTLAPNAGDTLEAALNGSRSGQEVRFRKTFTGNVQGGELPLDYAGHLSADGNRIVGKWRPFIAGDHPGGPFVMNRNPANEKDILRQLTALVENSV